MKTHRVMVGMGVVTFAVLLAQGQDQSPASGRFQLEYSRNKSSASLIPTRPTDTLSPSNGEKDEVKSSMLRAIVGTDEASVDERYNAVHALSRNLSGGEIAALYVFLKAPPSPNEENLPAVRLLKNDILDVLLEQTAPPKGLTDIMIGIYESPSQDKVSRDYAIQHLVTWYEFGASDARDAKEKIRAVLRTAAHDRSSIAGTALLGWHRLAQRDAAFDPDEINRLALNLARSTETDLATRITAIQVCAERGLKEVLPVAESLAKAQVCLPLRRSAISAMKRLGSSEMILDGQLLVNTKEETGWTAKHLALQQAQRKEKNN